jgi:hypothetical protein
MKLTSDLISRRNSYSLWKYEDAVKAIHHWETDKYQSGRLSVSECKTCYYLKNGASLQAFTNYICKNCNQEKNHHDSSTPDYCPDCCKEHNVCRRCGADV